MRVPHILHHGAVSGVPGSCRQLLMDATSSLLIDCGLFQGAEISPEGSAGVGNLTIDFSLDGIKALVATDVHVDHVGRIPYLLAAVFKGPILCSEPSAKLLPIVPDSSLASRFAVMYRELDHLWDAEARTRLAKGRNPLVFRNLFTVDSHQARLAIVIAGNGMCSSGRIVNYLKAMLGDAQHDALFVGYQADGTPEQQIQRFGPRGGYVEFDGQCYDIRAQVHTIGGYSAHADQKGLVGFVTRMTH